jgi:hypothetical protein
MRELHAAKRPASQKGRRVTSLPSLSQSDASTATVPTVDGSSDAVSTGTMTEAVGDCASVACQTLGGAAKAAAANAHAPSLVENSASTGALPPAGPPFSAVSVESAILAGLPSSPFDPHGGSFLGAESFSAAAFADLLDRSTQTAELLCDADVQTPFDWWWHDLQLQAGGGSGP